MKGFFAASKTATSVRSRWACSSSVLADEGRVEPDPLSVSTVASDVRLVEARIPLVDDDEAVKRRPAARRAPHRRRDRSNGRSGYLTGHMHFLHEPQRCRTSSPRAAPSKNGALASSYAEVQPRRRQPACLLRIVVEWKLRTPPLPLDEHDVVLRRPAARRAWPRAWMTASESGVKPHM